MRLRSAAILVVCAALVCAGLYVRPDPGGIGTHRQLGLPACSWPTTWSIPCPTCGMTTAFAHTVRGQWVSAIRSQPFGWLVAVCVLAGGVLSAYSLAAGKSWRVNWFRVKPSVVLLGLLAMALAAWGYKILAMRGQFG